MREVPDTESDELMTDGPPHHHDSQLVPIVLSHSIPTCKGHRTLTIYSSFQMTVKSNYVIAIDTLSDWLKRLVPVFQPMRSKTKTNRAMYA